jgi:hypothetical protein
MSDVSVATEATRRGEMPFALRAGASINECVNATGLSRSRIYQLMKAGEIEFVKDGARTIIKVQSLLKRIGLIDASTTA